MPAAVTDSYATFETYSTIYGKQNASQAVQYAAVLEAVSRYMDWRLGRFFTKDAAAVARVLTPGLDALLGYNGELFTPDIVSVSASGIKVDTDRDGLFTDETAFALTDYQLHPVNAPYGPEPRPYTQIVIPYWSTKSAWEEGYPVEITAVWGWPAVPKAIELACCRLANIWQGEGMWSTRRVTEMGEVLSLSKKASDILDELMAPYGRTEF